MIHDLADTAGVASVLSDIERLGMRPLFHGTNAEADFCEFGGLPGRRGRYANCEIGVHVTSNLWTALDYADADLDRSRVLIAAAAPGRFGIISDRDGYIGMTGEDVMRILSHHPDLTGFVADDLGSDLDGAGVILDPSRVLIMASMPAPFVISEMAAISAQMSAFRFWDGADLVALDLEDLLDDAPGPRR